MSNQVGENTNLYALAIGCITVVFIVLVLIATDYKEISMELFNVFHITAKK